ncbi:transglutaminase domain-containing protein [candidate division CSSED10-310 bacterium]|uniref:Transglutaminase domain-containing protein n=1 Tax=candidate division CSSED10-310 bacterium TaxID=2855610 RepID=A0ABV6YZ34_UNCC1
MKTPPLLLGFVLLFWGWQTGFFIVSLVLALLLEAHRLVTWRLSLQDRDFNRIADLSAVVVFVTIVYLFVTRDLQQTLFTLYQLLPFALFPLVLAQYYSSSGTLSLSALFWTYRHRKQRELTKGSGSIDLSLAYIGLCILSSSAVITRTLWYYIGLFIIVSWLLWITRSRRYSPLMWFLFILLAGGIGFAGHNGLHQLQQIIDARSWEWFSKDSYNRKDLKRSFTFMGELGQLKLSDRIVFRVRMQTAQQQATLLKAVTYNVYQNVPNTGRTVWMARKSGITSIAPGHDGGTWILDPYSGEADTISISETLGPGIGILKLPPGTFRISNLPVAKLQLNQLGTVSIEDGPGLVSYTVHAHDTVSVVSEPGKRDLAIPAEDLPAVQSITEKLNLAERTPQAVIQEINRYFRTRFSYSLQQAEPLQNKTALTTFLSHSRTGHCEFFATATTLLLRAVGIPARYATGYVVHEFSKLENCYLVRSRDAHAWTQAFVEGHWINVDSTPPDWITIAEDDTSAIRFVADVFSWLTFSFSEWRAKNPDKNLAQYSLWLLIPLALILVYRLFLKTRLPALKKVIRPKKTTTFRIGQDSAFYLIEQKLLKLGFQRQAGETFSDFIKRIKKLEPAKIDTQALLTLLPLHYRYRFDPAGISNEEHDQLTTAVQDWLQRTSAS